MRLSVGYLDTLPDFLAWFGLSAALAAVFMLIYAMVTPWAEFRLIRQGNAAAALSFAGTLAGYALVLSGIIRNAVSRGDMLSWAIVGMAVQFLALIAGRLILGPGLRARMERGEMAAGLVLAGLSLAFGLLNAATMTPDAAAVVFQGE